MSFFKYVKYKQLTFFEFKQKKMDGVAICIRVS